MKKEKWTRSTSSNLDRKSLVNKGFIMWLSREFFSRDTRSSREGEDSTNYLLRQPNTVSCLIFVCVPTEKHFKNT